MKLLKRHDDSAAEEAPKCEHITLIPSWDAPDDIGHEDRATSFRCEACGEVFSLDAAEHLRATEKARVLRRLAS
jgi:hypothetical protein